MTATTKVKWTLQRVRLNSGGYDASGSYWGVDKPLYWAGNDEGASFHFRAADREKAKAFVRAEHPNATFYN
jgi:hypothetical protein